MIKLRILADDLTGALDCAAAFGAGAPVHLGQPSENLPEGLDIVATATRDVELKVLPDLLTPSLPWLRSADLSFKKVDSLLRGNTFDEVDWIARHGKFSGVVLVPAFPSQKRITQGGQQWWSQPDGTARAVAQSMTEALTARGWTVSTAPHPPAPAPHTPTAWIPDVVNDHDMQSAARHAGSTLQGWLWCGSAGLAQALAHTIPGGHTVTEEPSRCGHGLMLISASHHAVSREQWRQLRNSPWAPQCLNAEDPHSLHRTGDAYPRLLDLSAQTWLSSQDAADLLNRQTQAIAQHAPRPQTLVVVGGDTLLSLCKSLGARGLTSDTPLDRAGWGCARMVGGLWDGLRCHTRSGAFGGPLDLLEVLRAVDPTRHPPMP